MLMGEDPQLQVTVTPHGSVRFVQIVGACLEELQAVQRWNGPGVLQILKRHSVYVYNFYNKNNILLLKKN
jgi:suppressor of fused-like protein